MLRRITLTLRKKKEKFKDQLKEGHQNKLKGCVKIEGIVYNNSLQQQGFLSIKSRRQFTTERAFMTIVIIRIAPRLSHQDVHKAMKAQRILESKITSS